MKNKETISEFKILIKLDYLNKFSCFFFFLWANEKFCLGLVWELLQAHLVLLLFTLLRFCSTVFFTNWRFMQPSIGQICQHHFSSSFAHFVPLCHILVILTIFQTFSLLYLLWWSVIFDVTTTTCWRLRWWLAFFSNKLLFN